MPPFPARRIFFALLAAAAPAWADTPADRAVITFDIPDKSKLMFDGRDQGERREVTVNGCEAGRIYLKRAEVRLPDGSTVNKEVCYRGGWEVRVRVAGPTKERPELVAQSGHSDAAFGLAFTPDGQHVVTGAADRTAILWEVASGRQVRTYSGHPNMVMGVAVSRDGSKVALAVGRHQTFIEAVGGAWVYELRTGKELYRAPVGGPVQSVAFTPDGDGLLLGTWDGKVALWDMLRNKAIWQVHDHAAPVWSVAVSADGLSVVTGSLEGTAAVRDAKTGRVTQHLRVGASVSAAAFHKDGRVLLGAHDGSVALWDARTGQRARSFRTDAGTVINAAALSADGARVVATGTSPRKADGNNAAKTGDNGFAAVWDADTGKEIHRLTGNKEFPGHAEAVLAAAFHPSGRAVGTAGWDKKGVLWKAEDGAPKMEYRSRLDRPWGHAFSPDGKQVVGGTGEGGAVVRWTPTGDTVVRALASPHTAPVKNAYYAQSGDRYITGCDDHTAVVWDAATASPIATLPKSADPQKGHSDWVIAARLSHDGKTAFTSSRAARADGKLLRPGWGYLWEAGTGKLLRCLGDRRGTIWDAEFTPDGRHLVTADGDELEGDQVVDGKAVVWEVATGRRVRDFGGHKGLLTLVTVSPDGKRLLTAGKKDKTMCLWELSTGKKLFTYEGFDQPVSAAFFSADGNYVLVGSYDGVVRLKEVATGKTVRSFGGHTGPADVLAPRPGGRYFLSGGGDGVLRYWDIATGEQLAWLVTIDGGRDWLAATRDGLFDGTKPGFDNVRYRTGGELNTADADRFFKDFYRPGLLRELWDGVPPVAKAKLGAKPAPAVAVKRGAVDGDKLAVEVTVRDQGGGIGQVIVRRNGMDYRLRATDSRPAADGKGEVHTFQVPLAVGRNNITAQATADAPGAPESDPKLLVHDHSKPRPPVALYLLAVGVDKSDDPKLPPLAFPAADARAIVNLLEARAKGKGLYDRVVPDLRLGERSSAAEIKAALDALAANAQIGPSDTLVVYLSGHGLVDKQTGDFFFAASGTRTDDLRGTALSGVDLFKRVKDIKAGCKFVVVDACHSGAIGADLFRGSFTELERNTGIVLLTAAAGHQAALEGKRLKHGVLTFSLLRGADAVRDASFAQKLLPLPGNSYPLSVGDWCHDARKKVFSIMDIIGLRDVIPFSSTTARDFPLLGPPLKGGE